MDAKKFTSVKDNIVVIKENGKEIEKHLTQIPRPPPLFTYRGNKKLENAKFHNFSLY